ncbi:uncharacterized protein MICPUCDRAFT_58444 [Micromonas pusilla CCMP1545]|uniref:Predicted protein n=1 Tax=Micromonas pusilla (strain CCMP1545) TaxID=564608 RepID=C1MSD4_MICPC|nr:uncharacterized protein MICPUCDRAFT_58444 [Micromonas pusilla CCMP1545]EEH57488.1 predicted protein [Micromonas pusilla CCMP1545]|eukprot:XP_003059033.1 predicted protein [Micromonas pusilla CCMP1545]
MHVLRASTAASASAASRPSPRTRSRAASRPPRPRGARPRDRRGREKEAIRRDAISLRAAAKNDAETRGGGGDDDAEDASIKPTNASGGGANDGAGEPTMADARRKFSETFWAGIEKNRGGVPWLRPREEEDETRGDVPDDFATTAAEANAREKKTKTKTTTTTTTTISAASSSATSDEEQGEKGEGEEPETFWRRCTLLGLAIGAWMITWGLRSTHYPTLKWLLANLGACAWDPELGWSVASEVARRLGAPALRVATGWLAMRSRWRGAAACGALSFVVPDVVAEMAAS